MSKLVLGLIWTTALDARVATSTLITHGSSFHQLPESGQNNIMGISNLDIAIILHYNIFAV